MKIMIVSMAAAMLLAGAQDAAAQDRSSTRGLMLGASLNASAIQLDEDGGTEAENGVGGGLALGYGLNERIMLFFRVAGANISADTDGEEEGSFTLASAELGGRYTFGTTAAALRPYAELGFAGTGLGFDADFEGEPVEVLYSGGGLFLGGGLEYFFSRKAALDVGLAVGKGRFTTVEVDGDSTDDIEDLDFTTTRLTLGISFRP